MTPPPSKSADLHETVVHSFDGVVKDGGEAQSQSASDASSMSAAVDKKPDSNTWILISALLVLSTLLQSLKPSEPYIPDFWRKTKGLTPDEFNTSPAYRSYAMTIMLPIVSYSSEYLVGYVPAIVFGLLCRWLCQFTFYFTNSLTWLKASFAIFGLSHSTKTIYSAFTYSMVPVHAFHRITAYIRSANFVAHVLGGSIGNLIDRHMEQNPYFFMFLLSQICVGLGVIAFVAAIGLNYVYKVGSKDALANIKPPTPKSFREAKELFQSLYHSVDVRIWSTFFIFSYAAVDVIWDYQPILFGEVERKLDVHSYKGFVMAGTRLGCATASIIAGRSRTVYAKWHLIIMTLSGGIIGLCFVLNYFFQHYIHALYVLFFILMVVNEFCVCGITAQIAVKTQQSMRGMVLLLNMTVAMLFQSGLQFTFNRLGFGLLTRYVVLALCLFLFSGGMLLYMFGQLLLVYVRNVISPIRRQRNNNAPRI